MDARPDSPSATSALTLQLLSWIASQPRTYEEAMDAWRTSCPRMPIWEDAVSSGLVALEGGGTMRNRQVVLTTRGRALFNTARNTLNEFAFRA